MPAEAVDKHNYVLIPQGLFAQITRYRLGRMRYIFTHRLMIRILSAISFQHCKFAFFPCTGKIHGLDEYFSTLGVETADNVNEANMPATKIGKGDRSTHLHLYSKIQKAGSNLFSGYREGKALIVCKIPPRFSFYP
jgi:hypothetical protein